MYKVLVSGVTDENKKGGIESMVLNYYSRFDHNKVHFDFICNTDGKIAYHKKWLKYGSKVYYVPQRGDAPFNYYRQSIQLFKKIASEYDCFWFNTSDLANIFYLKLAKRNKISTRIVHSHNSRMIVQGKTGKLYSKFHDYHRKNISKYATNYWACSKVAAKWMYPSNIIPQSKIIKNAIDVFHTSFNAKKREDIREKYNLTHNFVIGNVGRLTFQKNQEFIIRLAPKIKKKIPNAKFVIVGQGEEKENLINLIKKYKLEQEVLLVGQQNDMQGWYSTFDMFLFPSLFEGLSVSLLETQANGIPILSSANVSPKEVKVNDNFSYLTLTQSDETWVNYIYNIYENGKRLSFKDVKLNFKEHDYDIDFEAPKLEQLFIEIIKNKENS